MHMIGDAQPDDAAPACAGERQHNLLGGARADAPLLRQAILLSR